MKVSLKGELLHTLDFRRQHAENHALESVVGVSARRTQRVNRSNQACQSVEPNHPIDVPKKLMTVPVDNWLARKVSVRRTTVDPGVSHGPLRRGDVSWRWPTRGIVGDMTTDQLGWASLQRNDPPTAGTVEGSRATEKELPCQR